MIDVAAAPPAGQASTLRLLLLGFVAGALAVLTFHQGAVALFTALGWLNGNVYSLRPVPPFGVPQIASNAFWGGVWGLVFALVASRLTRRGGYWLFALLLGALALPMVGWFVVAPIRGQPPAGGWNLARMGWSMAINGCWGLGIGVWFALLTRRRF